MKRTFFFSLFLLLFSFLFFLRFLLFLSFSLLFTMGGNAMSKRLERAEKTGVFALEEADLDEIPPRLFELQKIVRVLDLSGNKIGKLSVAEIP